MKEIPTFSVARPSSKGIFYYPDIKWRGLGLPNIREGLDMIGIRFEEKDEV